MRILGIDPGSLHTGFGVVECIGSRATFVTAGVISPGDKTPLEARLARIFAELTRVVAATKPDAIAIEGVFAHRNARSALILGHARGVALLMAGQTGTPVFEYPPARVKAAVGASGRGSKSSVAWGVGRLLNLEAEKFRADAYDALAVALCHSHRAGSVAPLVKKRVTRGRRGWPAAVRARLRPALVANGAQA